MLLILLWASDKDKVSTHFHVAHEIERKVQWLKRQFQPIGKWHHEGALEAYGGAGDPNLLRQESFLGETIPTLSCRDDYDLGAGCGVSRKRTSWGNVWTNSMGLRGKNHGVVWPGMLRQEDAEWGSGVVLESWPLCMMWKCFLQLSDIQRQA